ncbi:DGQHR domain-containing protein [Candidatus Parcubacteria bacterium]|nr:MAG: DGQHR domain-containing protein [Candidatus Parcubacteria bacterium]
MKQKELIVRALRTEQGEGVEVYSFFAPGDKITEIADISRVCRDESDALGGFQRKEIRNHVNKIVEYLDMGKVIFPNSIILAFSPEVDFKQSRGQEPKGCLETAKMGTLTIPIREEGKRVAWIVDGQQRSLALSKTKNNKIPVPVVAFVAPDLETQRSQFILVNKAKPLPTRLINELLPEVDTHLPKDLSVRKIPSELCNLLNIDPKSPFYKLIERESLRDTEQQGIINDTAIMEVIRKSLYNPLGALSPFKGLGDNPADTDGMYKTLILFWGQVKEVFPEAWGLPPTKSRLMHGTGIKALGVLMDRIMARINPHQNAQDVVRKSLIAIAPSCAWTDGIWDGLGLKWNEVQNISSHIRALSDYLVKLDYENSQRKAV